MDINLTISQMIEAHAATTPDHTAILADDSSYSYKELNQKANQLAHFLQKFALPPDTLIAISVDRSPELIIGILGILKAGCAYLPLDASQPESRLQYILEDTEAPILITQARSKDKFSEYAGCIITIDQDCQEIHSQPLSNLSCSSSPQNLAYVIYTSGSTGKPKGVMIEHQSVLNYSKWFNEYTAMAPQARVDFSSNIIFDMAVTTTIAALTCGLQIVMCSDAVKKNVSQYLRHLQKYKINLAKLTPSYFKALTQEAKSYNAALENLKCIILGGERLLTKDCMAWFDLYPKHILFNEYGPTEATVAVTQYKITRETLDTSSNIVPIGKAGKQMACYLINENELIETAGEAAELYIGGACLARGYFHQPELTAKQFIHHPIQSEGQDNYLRLYKTGDICRYLADGNLEFIKRTDDQVKIRGYRIEPGEIEACLTSHVQIKECSVQARTMPSGEQQLIAYYSVMNPNHHPHKDELRKYLQQRLADYMIPAVFLQIPSFPLTSNGKLDTRALPEPPYEKEMTSPQTRLERQLVNIWQNAFQKKKISINSNFFELGGHSLLATRIIAEIEKSLGKKIQLKDLYNAPTVCQLALKIKNAENSSNVKKQANTSLIKDNSIPLGDFQFMLWMSTLIEPLLRKVNIIARRRLSGKLNIDALTCAFHHIFKKHGVLSYQVSKYIPAQFLKNDFTFKIVENDLTACTDMEAEARLCASLDELNKHSTWHKYSASIAARLFHLKNEVSELQISVPHFLFDDASEQVLFNDLSTAYLECNNGLPHSPNKHAQFKDYVIHERNHLNQNLERDINFWENYLEDTSLAVFPKEVVVYETKNHSYSTYVDIPHEVINNIHQICAKHSFNLTDLLCASVALTIKKTTSQLNNNVYVNVIRSMRDNEIHDKMIGCFLRLDPIKVDANSNLNLVQLAKNIQQSRIEIDPYQACSGMIKLACLEKNYRKKFFRNAFIELICKTYVTVFSKLRLNPTLLQLYTSLNSLRKKQRIKQQFMITINLLHNFISPSNDKTLFGMPREEIKTYKCDLSNIDNVLDVCILRNESLDKSYLVLSANLNASFRQLFGEEIIRLLAKENT